MIARVAKITALGMAFVVIVGISAYLTLTLFIKSEDTVIVPELVGKDVVYALEILTDMELNTKVKGTEFSPAYPKHHVLFQDPEAGTEIKKGRDVRIVLSKGPRQIPMPSLANLSKQKALIMIEENGLCLGNIAFVRHPSVGEDRVLAHTPRAGMTVDRSQCVDLLISSGNRSTAYAMPDLEGLSVEDAIAVMEKMKLRIDDISSSFQKNRPPETVVDQQPLAGYRITANAPVRLTLNRPTGREGPIRQTKTEGKFFRYRLSEGFLKKRIRVQVTSDGFSHDIFDEYVKPGTEIWFLIPAGEGASVALYEDGSLIKTETYDQ